jgi:hypothetical protein
MIIPNDFPVRPLDDDEITPGRTTCGTCDLSWDDSVSTDWTPAPSGRCPFESFHSINGADYVLSDLSDQAHVDHVMHQARYQGATVAYWDNRSDLASPGWVLRRYRGGDYDETIIV